MNTRNIILSKNKIRKSMISRKRTFEVLKNVKLNKLSRNPRNTDFEKFKALNGILLDY